MADKRLLNALRASTKELRLEDESKAEIDFIVKHRTMFADNADQFYDALRSVSKDRGDNLLQALGYGEMLIRKTEKTEILASCYDFRRSKLLKMFLDAGAKHGKALTMIFTSGVHAVVVSNTHDLQVHDGKPHTMNVLRSNDDKFRDIYWAPIRELEGYKFYG